MFKFNVAGDKLTVVNEQRLYSGNVNYYRCEFDFTSDWIELLKFAVFVLPTKSYTVEIEENKCFFPTEALEAADNIYIGVFGSAADESNIIRISTNLCSLNVSEGAYREAVAASEGELSLWERYVAEAKAARDEAVAAAETASEANVNETVTAALDKAKQSGEFDGADGKDGVSLSHEWVGTTLKITSASGESSADLSGERGADGERGENGKDGEDGYTPVRGLDYMTDEDIALIVANVEENLTDRATKEYVDKAAEEAASSSYAYTDGTVAAAKKEILAEVDKARATYIEDGSGAHPLKHNEVAEMGIAKGGAFPDTYTLIIGAPIGDFPDVLFTIWHINPCEEAFDVSPDNTMKMLFFGDDCDETYSFTPRANTHYEISFMRQGSEDDKPRIIARVGAWE